VTTGYQKEFSYDNRLTYLTPPALIDVANLLWSPTSYVNCGDVNDNGPSFELASSNFCPGLLHLNT
jgi:hypothetical protein